MKILLLAPPRSASKWVFSNLIQYYQGYSHVWLHKDASPLTEKMNQAFEYMNDGSNLNYAAAFRNYLGVVSAAPGDLIAKLHSITYERGSEVEQIRDAFCAQFDVIYQITRRDHFGRCLSRALCNLTGHWTPTPAMRQTREQLRRIPIHVPLGKFLSILRTNDFTVWQHPNAHVVDFEACRRIRDQEGFCQTFGLAPLDFEYITPELEFGDKSVMIANYAELRAVYQRYVTTVYPLGLQGV